MAQALLVDTDVLVEYLRGKKEAVSYLEAQESPLLLSAISVAELFAGARGEKEERALETFLGAFEIVPADRKIARTAGKLRRRYGPSHGTGLADAIIGASAQERGVRLATFNRKHFPFLPDLLVPYPRK